MSEQIGKQIAKAMVAAQKEFSPALKKNLNAHFKNRYADLASCVDAVIDALNKNNIYLMQKTHECDSGIKIETVFIHESGESLSAGILTVPAAKQDPQGYGSALTYARRYALLSACGMAPEDDDGNHAAKAIAEEKNKIANKAKQAEETIVEAKKQCSLEELALIKKEIEACEDSAALMKIYKKNVILYADFHEMIKPLLTNKRTELEAKQEQ